MDILKSKRLDHLKYEIRGPVYDKALALQNQGYKITSLNIGNPAAFGFETPDEIVHDIIVNIRNAQGYVDSRGLFAARKAVMQYYQNLGVKNILIVVLNYIAFLLRCPMMFPSRRPKGFTLIELMVALVIGLVLMLGLTTFLINNIRSNSDTLKAIRLNQEMRATMMLMSRELRRAGYWASTASGTNPFQTMTTSTAGCVLYSYDRNATASATVPSATKSSNSATLGSASCRCVK